MQIRLLKSKLHMAKVTSTNLYYHGSVTIDEDLMDAVGLLKHEAVLIGNLANGARGETYVIAGPRGKGDIMLNGAMARLAEPGDRLVILSFAFCDPAEAEKHRPKIALLDANNRIGELHEG